MLDALCSLPEHLKIANSLLNDLWNSRYKSNRSDTGFVSFRSKNAMCVQISYLAWEQGEHISI